jgi:hypothetical protein
MELDKKVSSNHNVIVTMNKKVGELKKKVEELKHMKAKNLYKEFTEQEMNELEEEYN